MTVRVHPISVAALTGTLLLACGACAGSHTQLTKPPQAYTPQLPAVSHARPSTYRQTDAGARRLPPVEVTPAYCEWDSPGLFGADCSQAPFPALTDEVRQPAADAWSDDNATLARDLSRRLRRERRRSNLRTGLLDTHCKVRSDYQNFYNWVTMRDLLIGISAAGIMANTSIDESFQRWYEDDVRTAKTDHFAAFWKSWGEGEIFIPAFIGFGLIGAMAEDRPLLEGLGVFGGNAARAYGVGGPPMLLLQFTLGASRPHETSIGSNWQPFQDDNGISGHAFIGAVPFITAAGMTDNLWLKTFFYTCSTFTGWSRVNDGYHYLSQVGLGWWMAYLSCRAVQQTDAEHEQLRLSPLVTSEMVGGCVVLRR